MNEIRDHVISLLVSKFDVPAEMVTTDTTLEDMDLDSLARVELLVTLEERWHISLTDDDDSSADISVEQLVQRVRDLVDGDAGEQGRPA